MASGMGEARTLAVYDAIFAGIGDGLIVVDTDGKVVFMNQAAGKMLFRNPVEVKGKDYTEVVPAADQSGRLIPGEERPFHAVLKTGVVFSNHAVNFYVRSDNSRFPAAVTTAPVVFENSIIGAVVSFRDITKNAEIDRMKNEFLSLASHQLRTPLSAMKWFLEMLLSGDAGKFSNEQLEFLKNINDSNNRMIALVNDLLNITRIESGRILIEPKPTDLGKLVSGLVAELKPKIDEKQLKFVVSVNHDLKEVNIDPNLIRMVYLNLISNAIKYTPSGGEIMVIVSKKEDQIISQISDTGFGISDKEKPYVFQKFFRGSNIIKKVVEGTGLGLYLAKAIIESSNGKIWYKSQENKGTTFWFSFPAKGVLPKAGQVTINS